MDNSILEELNKLGFGDESTAQSPIEFVVPGTNQKLSFKNSEEIAQAFANITQAAQNQQAELQRQLQEVSKKAETKPKKAKEQDSDFSESDLEKFRKLAEDSPVQAYNFMLEKTPGFTAIKEGMEKLASENAQLRQAVVGADFVSRNKDVVIDSPNAPQIQGLMKEALTIMGVKESQVNPQVMQLALASVKGTHPQLFTQSQGANYVPGFSSGTPAIPPSPGRTSAPQSAANESQVLDHIYKTKGPAAMDEAIRKMLYAD